MLYALHYDGQTVIKLRDDNVYTRCPICGVNYRVDLISVMKDFEGDLHSFAMPCAYCSSQ